MSCVLKITFFIFTIGCVYSDKLKELKPPKNSSTTETPISRYGKMGVARIAEVTSRNGRVTTIGGIHFIPPFGPTQKSLESNKPSDKTTPEMTKMYPKVSKWREEYDGTIAEGFIKIDPNFIEVSSSTKPKNIVANSWPNSLDSKIWSNPLDPKIWPMSNLLIGPRSFPTYPRKMDWINEDVLNYYRPQNLQYMKQPWLYPFYI